MVFRATTDADPLVELLTVSAPCVDAEVHYRLDGSSRQLDAVRALRECRLSWTNIARIRRYTVNFNPAVEEYLKVIERNTWNEESSPAD
jgi:hypothetical protein